VTNVTGDKCHRVDELTGSRATQLTKLCCSDDGIAMGGTETSEATREQARLGATALQPY